MSWINLVKVILDIANDGPFFEIFIKKQDDLVDKHEEYVFSRDNILVLINKSQNSSLRHEKTLSILDDQ